MNSEGSITRWVHALRKSGDPDAARELWERYFQRLVAVARREVAKMPERIAYDKEDVALSAFDVFCRGMKDGKYAGVRNRDELWRLLIVITVRKARDRAKRAAAKKRDAIPKSLDGELTPEEIAGLLSRERDPQLSALMAEECHRLLESLASDELEQVAMMKLDGYKNAEIAEQMGCTRQTVQRRLRLIREIWEAA